MVDFLTIYFCSFSSYFEFCICIMSAFVFDLSVFVFDFLLYLCDLLRFYLLPGKIVRQERGSGKTCLSLGRACQTRLHPADS